MRSTTEAPPINDLKDNDLISETKKLLGLERSVLCSFLINLAEIDSRKIYAAAGYPSLFKYVVKEFNLSESSAAKRIVVSRSARKIPRLLDEIKSGKLHLSGAYMLCKNIKDENFNSWFEKVQFKSKTEIEEMLKKEFSFSKSVREYIRPVVAPVSAVIKQEDKPQEARSLFDSFDNKKCKQESCQSPLASQRDSTDFEIRLGITVKKEVYENIKKLQRLTGKDKLSDVIEKAIKHYLELIDPEKKVERRKARKEKSKSRVFNNLATSPVQVNENISPKQSRHIPQKVKDEVYLRDQGRCTFINSEGKRCEAQHHLEFDHLVPFAKGGQSTVDNLILKCRAHNFLAAREQFGTEFMKRYQKSSQ